MFVVKNVSPNETVYHVGKTLELQLIKNESETKIKMEKEKG